MDFDTLVARARAEFLGYAHYELDHAQGQQTTWTAALCVVERITNFEVGVNLHVEVLDRFGNVRPYVAPIAGASQFELRRLTLATAVKQELDQDAETMQLGAGGRPTEEASAVA